MSLPGDSVLEAAIFDLGGVILDVRVENCFRHWARAVGTDSEEQRRWFGTDCHESFQRGEISPETFQERVIAELGRPIRHDDFLTGWNSILCGVMTGIEGLLAELSKITRLAILSNTNILHARFFREQYGQALQHFEKVFLSHEIGTRKPEPRCFQLVLDQLGLRAEETVFIDDDSGNVAAARQLGMKGIVAESADQMRRDLRDLGIDLTG